MANLNLAKAQVGGHVATDLSVRMTPNGTNVVSFTIAVNRKGETKATDFIRCVAWRQTAELIAKYFKKGSSILVSGTIQTREWEKEGVKQTSTEVVVDEFFFVDSKSENGGERTEAFTPVTDDALPF